MRRIYTQILLFYLILHFILPILYYYFFGYVNLYSDIEVGYSIFKSCFLNIVSVLGTIFVIRFLPDKKEKIDPQFRHSFKFFILCMSLFSLTVLFGGTYEEKLSGSLNGSFISYLLLFFDGTTALFIYLLLQKDIKHSIFSILLYVILNTIAGSRSAFLIIIILAFIMYLFKNSLYIKLKMRRFLFVICIISPMIFYYGTTVRGNYDKKTLINLIIGRVSMVEISAIPIESIESGDMDESLYDQKYGIINQFKQSCNEISPINPFESDINPNQYFRPIFFWDFDVNAIFGQYLSLNITLPVYFYLASNMFFGCILTILFLSMLYYIWVIKSNNIYIFSGIIISLYYLLQYFDWVMLTSGLFKIILTIFTLINFEKLINFIIKTLKIKS